MTGDSLTSGANNDVVIPVSSVGSLTASDVTLDSADQGSDISGSVDATVDGSDVRVSIDTTSDSGTGDASTNVDVTVSVDVDDVTAQSVQSATYTLTGENDLSGATDRDATFEIIDSNNPSYSATSTPDSITVQSSDVTQDLAGTDSIEVDVANEGEDGVTLYADLSPLTDKGVTLDSDTSVGSTSVTNGAVTDSNVDETNNVLELTVDAGSSQNSFSITQLQLTGLDTSSANATDSLSYGLGFSGDSISADSTSNFAIQAGSPSTIDSVSVDQSEIAFGAGSATATATVHDIAGNPVDGTDVVNFDLSGDTADADSSISNVDTDTNGEATATISESGDLASTVGDLTVTAELAGDSSVKGTDSITVYPDNVDASFASGSSEAGSSEAYNIELQDEDNNALSDSDIDQVNLDVSLSSVPTDYQSNDASIGGTDLSGTGDTVTFSNVESASASKSFSSDQAGDHTLEATATTSSLSSANEQTNSGTITVNAANADSISLTQDVTESQTAGQAIDQSGSDPAVEVTDTHGNLVDSVDVTATLQGGSGSLTAGSTTSVSTTDGVATFTNLVTEKADTGYNLQFSIDSSKENVVSDPTTRSVSTSSFDVKPDSASELAFIQSPTETTAGDYIDPAVTVEVQDQYDNKVTSFSDDISVSVTGTGSLSGTTTVSPTDGVATFDSLNLTVADTYDLTASTTADGVSDTAQSQFEVTAAATDEVTINSPSSEQIVKSEEAVNFDATALDQFDNTVTSSDADFTWKPDAVDSSGSFSTQTGGVYEVNATYGGVTSGSTTVTVDTAEPSEVSVELVEDGDGYVTKDDTVTVNVNVSDDISSATDIGVSGDASEFDSSLTLSEDTGGENDYTGDFTVGTPTTDESKDVSVTATDEAGNPNSTSESLTVDNTAPTVNSEDVEISDNSDSNGIVAEGDEVLVEINATDDTSGIDTVSVDTSSFNSNDSLEITETDSVSASDYTATFIVGTPGDADSATVSVSATDEATNGGSQGTASTSSLEVDNTAPTVSTTGSVPTDLASITGEVDVEGYFSSGASDVQNKIYEYKVSDSEGFQVVQDSNTSVFDTTEFSDGDTIKFRANFTDDAGNTGSVKTSESLTVDNQAPVIDSVEISDSADSNGVVADGESVSVAVNVTEEYSGISQVTGDASAFDPDAGLTLSTDTDSSSDYTGSFTVGTPGDGEKTVSVSATDRVSNGGSQAVEANNLTVDNSAPTVQSAAYRDSNSDGTVDKVDVEFSEPVSYTASDTVSNDWSVSTGSFGSFSIDGEAAVDGSTVTLTVSGDSGVTGVSATGTEPSIDYSTSGTDGITDDAGNEASATSEVSMTDEANPSITLNEGTNLVSFAVSDSSEYSVSEVLKEDETDEVWKRTADGWKVWTPEKSDSMNFNIRAGEGYLVESSSSYTVTPEIDEGTLENPFNSQIQLGEGWNLVGHYDEAPETRSNVLSALSSNVAQVWKNTGSGSIDYNKLASDSNFQPGNAYWVRTSSDLSGGSVAYGVN